MIMHEVLLPHTWMKSSVQCYLWVYPFFINKMKHLLSRFFSWCFIFACISKHSSWIIRWKICRIVVHCHILPLPVVTCSLLFLLFCSIRGPEFCSRSPVLCSTHDQKTWKWAIHWSKNSAFCFAEECGSCWKLTFYGSIWRVIPLPSWKHVFDVCFNF